MGIMNTPLNPHPMSPLRIGEVTVNPPLVLAPMAGLTDITFRRLVRRCGGVGLVVSEIVSSEGLTRGVARAEEMVRVAAGEHPIALQISGVNPERMASAARICVEAGADIVDINMGCPAKKVTRSGSGAAFSRDVEHAHLVTQSVVQASSVPVTVKFRLGWSETTLSYLELGLAVAEAGAMAVTLHARTRAQGYSGEADWAHVARLKEALSIPVIGNGDITSPESAVKRFCETSCDGIMVGRASLKNPWIFRQIADYLETGNHREPAPGDRLEHIRIHLGELTELPQKLALHRLKTFIGNYTRGVPGAASFRTTLEGHRDPEGLRGAFEEWVSCRFQGDP